MKNFKYILIIIFFYCTGLIAQGIKPEHTSNFHFGISGGANFNTIPTIGGSLILEAKFNPMTNVNLKLSVGYQSIFENKKHLIKSHNSADLNDTQVYQLKTYSIDKTQYLVVPVNLGIEYTFVKNVISPYAIFELGYSFYSSEKQITKVATGGEIFNSLEEIPKEYRNPAIITNEGSGIDGALGLGLKYKLSSSLEINLRYLYQYFDGMPNANQVLFGITF